MEQPRVSIAGMMGLVGAVAANVAAARALYAYNTELLVGLVPGMIVLQIAILRLFRSQGRVRTFWAGFIVAGLIVMASFAWAMIFPEVLGLTSTGTLVKTPGSPLYALWRDYTTFLLTHVILPTMAILRVAYKPRGGSIGLEIISAAIRSLIWSLPQLLGAILGGLIAWIVAARRGRVSERGSERAATYPRPRRIATGATSTCGRGGTVPPA